MPYFALGLGYNPAVYHKKDDVLNAAKEGDFQYLTGYFPAWQEFETKKKCVYYLKAFENYPSKLDWELGLKAYYAVGRGDRPGVYDTWRECFSAIGNCYNPKFRKFPTIRQCWLFVKAFAPVEDDDDSEDDDDFINNYGLYEQVGCRAVEMFLDT